MITAPAPFVRFSRDKRGYENFYLVQSLTNRRGKTRSRILYWFRTPPGVKVGRSAFSEEVQRAIEEQNPGVTFDWKRLISTPIPPPAPDVERWRERRRLEKAEKAARRALLAADDEPEGEGEAEADVGEPMAAASPELIAAPDVEASAPEQPPVAQDPAAPRAARKRRRRRRGGRQNRGPEAPQTNSTPPSSNSDD